MHEMESILIFITSAMCITLIFKLIYNLRLLLSWRVNCWFCNSNFWVKFIERNSWTCPKCEQYNGFTEDGDYNKPIVNNVEETPKTPKVFQRTLPNNGLCKMCNINQQLKVTQLANFVPMNEKKYDEEIENYRLQLEKAYKLCSPCKRVVQMKLNKEKETLLGSKLLEQRTPEKKQNKINENQLFKNFINKSSTFIATILFILVCTEFYKIISEIDNLSSTIKNIRLIMTGLLERLFTIMKMKTIQTFPFLENYEITTSMYSYMPLPNVFKYKDIDFWNITTQKALGGLVCSIQIVGNMWNVNTMKYTIILDGLWLVFVFMSTADHVLLDPLYICGVKMASILMILLVYKQMQSKKINRITKVNFSPKQVNNRVTSENASMDEEDSFNLDTDDDVSLSKFGIPHFTDSSTETGSPLNTSLINGRSFTPRSESLWTKPNLNSTFCVNSVTSKSPTSIPETVFAKPIFKKYQKLAKDDSDSELDESISSLCIGSPSKSKKKTNSIFSLRKFAATPSFVAPRPVTGARPLISPSKLGHGTSWVAGGYWGAEGERITDLNGSRSSSQSSGFESQTSSMNQRNLFSQPPSCEESVCSEPMELDRFPNMSFFSKTQPQFFPRMNSPIFPQMQYNSHVQIPQTRFGPPTNSQNSFNRPQSHVHVFKTPGGSGLIKLPQVDKFTTR